MSKPIFILAYANAFGDLPNLEKEKNEVLGIIGKRLALKDDFEIETPTTREELVAILKDEIKRKHIKLFVYSGHASGNTLLTEEERTNSAGLAMLLSQCSELKLILLNGCSTNGWVKELHDNFTKSKYRIPIIITTRSSINDEIAYKFGVAFIEQILVYGGSIKDAFDISMGIINTREKAQPLNVARFLEESAQVNNDNSWDISIYSNSEMHNMGVSHLLLKSINTNYKPNIKLLTTLIRQSIRKI